MMSRFNNGFLGPDRVVVIDLGRCMTGNDFHDTNWTAVDECTMWYFDGRGEDERTVVGMNPPTDWEFVRPVEGAITGITEKEVINGN